MKCNKTQSKWCINKHGTSKIIDTFEMYQLARVKALHVDACGRCFLPGGMFVASTVSPPLECQGKP
jgi:hypothetical protein